MAKLTTYTLPFAVEYDTGKPQFPFITPTTLGLRYRVSNSSISIFMLLFLPARNIGLVWSSCCYNRAGIEPCIGPRALELLSMVLDVDVHSSILHRT